MLFINKRHNRTVAVKPHGFTAFPCSVSFLSTPLTCQSLSWMSPGWQQWARCDSQVIHITANQRQEAQSPTWRPLGGGQLSVPASGSNFCLFFPKRGRALMSWVCTSMCTWTNEKAACRPSSSSKGHSVTESLLLEKKNQTSAVAGCYFGSYQEQDEKEWITLPG